MNYKTLFTAIFINYFVVLNAWAGCCFIDSSGGLYPCVDQIYDADSCRNESGVAFVAPFAICAWDGVTCCVGHATGFVFHNKGKIKLVHSNDCPPGADAHVRLPVVITDFTATLENDGHVSLEGTVTNLEEQVYMNIWRAQIGDLDQDGEKEITNLKKMTTTGFSVAPFEQVPFSTEDTNPLNGVNYYVLEEVNMNGKSSVYCDRIQSIALEGTPEPVLAESLCLKYTLVQVFTEF
jgi:hypothetical protein